MSISRQQGSRIVETGLFTVRVAAGGFADARAEAVAAALEQLAGALAALLGLTGDTLAGNHIVLADLLPEPSRADQGLSSGSWVDFEAAAVYAVYRPDAPGVELDRAVVRLLVWRTTGTDLATVPAIWAGLVALCSDAHGRDAVVKANGALLEQAGSARPSLADLWAHPGGRTASTPDPTLLAISLLDYLHSRGGPSGLRAFVVALGQGSPDRAARAAFHAPLSRIENEWWKATRARIQARTGGISRFLRSSLHYLRPYWKQELVILLCLGVNLAFQQILPRAQALLIDRAILPRDLHYLAGLALFLLGLVALVLVAGVVSDLVTTRVSESVLRRLRERMFARLQILSHRFYSQIGSGDIISRFTTDLRSVEQALTNTLTQGMFLLLSLVFSAVHILLINWILGLLVLASLPLFFVSTRLLGPPAQRASLEFSQQQAAVTGVLQEDIAAQSVIKSFNLQATMVERFGIQAQALYRSAVRLFFLSSLFGASANVLTVLVQVGILGLGGFFVIRGRLPLGNLFEFLALLGLVIGPVQSISGIMQSIQVATSSMDRVEEILDAQPDVRDLPDAAELGPLQHGMRFDGVSFSYLGGQPQLDGVDLEIPAGTSAAFVGPSGSGKSTLLGLVLRFYDPDQGRVLFDGLDATRVTLPSLRAQIGLVSQENFLFDTTVRENIRFGRQDATDAEVEEAARLAEIHEAIEQMPQGYGTPVGERGGSLSGGQRQRLAIARAILRKPSILVLDEATSALDPRTENAINQTLATLSHGRTTLTVTHRLATAADADQIFVLDRGRVVESGTHQDLLEANGLYRRLYDEQGGLSGGGDGAQRALAVSYLRSVPVFGALPDGTLSQLAGRLRYERVAPGAHVVEVGDAGDKLYLILSGDLEVLAPAGAGESRALATLGPGGYFGEIALLRDVPRTATVRARTDAELFSLDRDALRSLLEASSDLRLQLDAAIDARLAEVRSLTHVRVAGTIRQEG